MRRQQQPSSGSAPGPALRAHVEITRPGERTFRLAVDLAAEPGSVVAILGPNGAGKTTLLRAIAGLSRLDAGRIQLGDSVIEDPAAGVRLPAAARSIGVVFQDYRLFPTMTVRDNVAFAARSRGASKNSSRESADQWLSRFEMTAYADRRPSQLSGGQAQRIALLRALAREPALLLLDEPLAALDASIRGVTRDELRSYVASFAGPTLLVTHDPLDALLLADRVVVIEDGRVTQEADPATIASQPATAYIAGLSGLNHYRGRADRADGAVRLEGGGRLVPASLPTTTEEVLLALAPSAITVHTERPPVGSARNTWPGTVRSVQQLGDRVRLDVIAEPSALVDVTAAAVAQLHLAPGSSVWLSAKATEVTAYSAS